ncbi:hypothetical protein [Nitrososphaera sp.]
MCDYYMHEYNEAPRRLARARKREAEEEKPVTTAAAAPAVAAITA